MLDDDRQRAFPSLTMRRRSAHPRRKETVLTVRWRLLDSLAGPVPLSRRKVSAQLLRGAARTVAGRIALNAPSFPQWARIHRVEAELVQQTGNRGLGLLVVAGDDRSATILRAGWLPVGGERGGVDMIESFDDLRFRQVCLQKLGGRSRFTVELGNLSVALWVVVVRIDHDFARQGVNRNVPIVLERDRDNDDVPSFRCLDHRRRASSRSQLCDER